MGLACFEAFLAEAALAAGAGAEDDALGVAEDLAGVAALAGVDG